MAALAADILAAATASRMPAMSAKTIVPLAMIKMKPAAAAAARSLVDVAQGIEIPRGARGLAALPLTLGVADRSGRVWG